MNQENEPLILEQRVETKPPRRIMEPLLTASEVARIFSVSTAWVYDHAQRKRPRLPCVRLGKALRFRPEDVQRFIDEIVKRSA